MQAALAEYGAEERTRLAEGMERKKITICEDETLGFFHDEVRHRVETLALPAEQEELLLGNLIPAAYLQRVAARTQDRDRRVQIRTTLDALLRLALWVAGGDPRCGAPGPRRRPSARGSSPPILHHRGRSSPPTRTIGGVSAEPAHY